MENLNQIFWDSIKNLYPKSTAELDNYYLNWKVKNDWKALTDFRELPIEFQLGIFIGFVSELVKNNQQIKFNEIVFDLEYNTVFWCKKYFEIIFIQIEPAIS